MKVTEDILGAQWYLLQSKPRQEFRSAQELENQGYQVFLPIIESEKIRANKLEKVIEPLFSRYLFIRLNKDTDNWSPIRSTKGVSSIVRFGGQAARVSEELITGLKKFLLDIPAKAQFSFGDAVEVSAGPFKNLGGIFQNLRQIADGEVRAMVLIELMGKQQLLELQPSDLRVLA
jgi:transcriptional antiterminator RfaH